MNRIALVITIASLCLAAGPAAAQKGGNSPMQAEIDALKARDLVLQVQIDALQTQLNNLSAAIVGADDGTAAALVGTWRGSANSISFRRAVTNTNGSLNFEQFFALFPANSGGINFSGTAAGFSVLQPDNQPMTVQVNPEMWLARGDSGVPVTLEITREGLNLAGTGVASPAGDPVVAFELLGAALRNNFFLLKLRVPSTGNCAAGGFMILQGTASLNATRTAMSLMASGLEGDCRHMILRVGLTKQP